MPHPQSHPPDHATKRPNAPSPVPRLRPLSLQDGTPPTPATESSGNTAHHHHHHHTHPHAHPPSHGAALSKVEMTRFETVDYMAEVDTHDTIEVELRPTDLSSPAQVIRLKAGETVQNVKKKIISTPGVTFAYSDFDLVFNGRSMLDPLSLTDVPGIVAQQRPVVQVALRSGLPLALPPMESTCLGSLIEVVGSGTPRVDRGAGQESQPASCSAACADITAAPAESATGHFASPGAAPIHPEVVQLDPCSQDPECGVCTPTELGFNIANPAVSGASKSHPMSHLPPCSDSPFAADSHQERPKSTCAFTHSPPSSHNCPVPPLSLTDRLGTHSLVSSPQSSESVVSSERTSSSDLSSGERVEPVHSSQSSDAKSSRELEGDVSLFSSPYPNLPSISLTASVPVKSQQNGLNEQQLQSVVGPGNSISYGVQENHSLDVPHIPERVIEQYIKEHQELHATIERAQRIISELQHSVDEQSGQHESVISQEAAFSLLKHNKAMLGKLREDVVKAQRQLEQAVPIIKLQSEELSVVESRIASLRSTNQTLKRHWEQANISSPGYSASSF